MKLLEDYFALQGLIYEHFGYVEDWAVIPLRDLTASHWMIDQAEGGSGHVVWSDRPLSEESIASGIEVFSARIYTQRFLPRWVYRAGGHTMVSIDTRTDGNKFLAVFDDANEETSEQLKAAYRRERGGR